MKQTGSPRSEQGVALLLMLFLLIGSATTFFLYAWNTARQNIERDQVTLMALQQAKEALIGRAILGRAITSNSTPTPGRFPCPELLSTSAEGEAATSCNTQATRIGRLPWKSLGLEKLQDGYGEPLWYVISTNFTTAPINSSTTPQLQLDGVPNAVVALIFAPGPALDGQTRTVASTTSPPLANNYLDLSNAGGVAFVSKGPSSTFNDHVVAITQAELLGVLHKRVLSEVRGLDDLTGGLKRYHNENGSFPWADANGDGIADAGQVVGRIPYLPSGTLVFDTTTKTWLENNNWFPLIGYSRLSASVVQISLGSYTLKVYPCTAAPCP